MDALPDVGAPLPDVIALARAMLRQDAEGMGFIFDEYGFDVKTGGLVGELCGLFIGLALFASGEETVDGLLTRLYESALSES
jgi:hypothetical protein